MNFRYIQKAALGIVGAMAIGLTGCSDFLDRKPLDQVSPEQFYSTADQLSSFTWNYYNAIFSSPGGWNAGIATWDNGTDNQAGPNANVSWFTPDRWRVPQSGGISFNSIRNVNWFIKDIEDKRAAGKIAGNPAEIDQYLGEAYFIRAKLYFDRVQSYGDYPLVTEPLSDDKEELLEAVKRQPRNEVVRFILKDLDKAYELVPSATQRKQRISKHVVALFKSRVALYEGTFEKYHRGSGRVPGDAQWPGKDKEWNKGKTFDQEGEVRFFLGEAMKSAKIVADAVTLTPNSGVMNPEEGQFSGWNRYYEMFADKNTDQFNEVLLWRQYSREKNVMHITSHYLMRGSSSGWTRSLVESFLMKNGLPIYADNSGYKGDRTIEQVKEGRDERLQLFLFSENNTMTQPGGTVVKFNHANFLGNVEERDATGYRQRKYYNYDPSMNPNSEMNDESGAIIFRATEAYLNYIEASYELNTNLDGDAIKYWKALRQRANVSDDIQKTINATNMGYEADVNRNSYDWGAFSAGQPIDATLYSIRRERRTEFAGEGMRGDDLIRWRAMDQVKNYVIEGVNLWDHIYSTDAFKDKDGNNALVADGTSKSTASKKELSKYLRPYQIVKENNIVYDGYTFVQGHYLSPFSNEELRLGSPTDEPANSNLYQNPGWGVEIDSPAQ